MATTSRWSRFRFRPARASERGGRRGIALVIVLLCTALFYILITEFTTTARIEEHASRNVKFRGEAYYVALGGVNLLKMYLKTDSDLAYDSLDDDWAKWGRKSEVKSLPFSRFFVTAVADAESGKINVNLFNEAKGEKQALYVRTLKRLELLIAAVGYENDFNMTGECSLAREIVDFVDEDTASWDNSTEPDYYPNQPLISVTELIRVKGMRQEIMFGYTRAAATDADADQPNQTQSIGAGGETVPGLIDFLTVYGETSAAMGADKFNPSFMPRYLIVATILDWWDWKNALPDELKDKGFSEKVAEAKKYADQLIQFRENYVTKKADDWNDPAKTAEESGKEEPKDNSYPWSWPKSMWGEKKGEGYHAQVLRFNGQYFVARILINGGENTLGKGTLEYLVAFKRTPKAAAQEPSAEQTNEKAEVQTLLWLEQRVPEMKSLDELTRNKYLR